MPPRSSHTAIWRVLYIQQNGYYAVSWHTSNDGIWHGSYFEFGAHPYPTTGAVNANGQSLGGTGSVGTVHFYEIAGLGTSDFIASPGPASTFPVVKGVWITQARTCEVVNATTIRHRFWPDISNPAAFIEQEIQKRDLDAAAAAAVAPAFVIGCSPWTASGSTNSETPSGKFRGIKLFSAPLSIVDIQAEAGSGSNSPITSAGRSSVWYMNENPTPSDIADKSGSEHSPVWANSNRPRLAYV